MPDARALDHGNAVPDGTLDDDVPVIESSSIGHATTALLDLVLSRADALEPIA